MTLMRSYFRAKSGGGQPRSDTHMEAFRKPLIAASSKISATMVRNLDGQGQGLEVSESDADLIEP